MKGLVGAAPGGGFSFLSSHVPGDVLDNSLTVRSGMLNQDLWKLVNS